MKVLKEYVDDSARFRLIQIIEENGEIYKVAIDQDGGEEILEVNITKEDI